MGQNASRSAGPDKHQGIVSCCACCEALKTCTCYSLPISSHAAATCEHMCCRRTTRLMCSLRVQPSQQFGGQLNRRSSASCCSWVCQSHPPTRLQQYCRNWTHWVSTGHRVRLRTPVCMIVAAPYCIKHACQHELIAILHTFA